MKWETHLKEWTSGRKTEEQINDLQDRVTERNLAEQKRKGICKMRIDLRNSDSITKVHRLGVPREKDKEKGTENPSEEIIATKFPNLGKETYPDPGGTENP